MLTLQRDLVECKDCIILYTHLFLHIVRNLRIDKLVSLYVHLLNDT